MSVRPDVRLEDAPMISVTCAACGSRVEARKSSWEQTTIQWHGEALETCLERRGSAARPGPNGGTFFGCSALLSSIREAAVRGEVLVQDPQDAPVHAARDAPPVR